MLMKAIPVAGPEDPPRAALYRNSADLLLFDAKPPKSMPGALPGGNGLVFDWTLIAGQKPETPWMLSGGLTAENVSEAIRVTGAEAVDVSSGVEDAPGRKNPELIGRFVRAAKAAGN
jgi:phosphoribosylanthranilate isomerase